MKLVRINNESYVKAMDVLEFIGGAEKFAADAVVKLTAKDANTESITRAEMLVDAFNGLAEDFRKIIADKLEEGAE